jgi:hypothetical protein
MIFIADFTSLPLPPNNKQSCPTESRCGTSLEGDSSAKTANVVNEISVE